MGNKLQGLLLRTAIEVGVEEASNPVASDTDFNILSGIRNYQFLTLPTDFTLYKITGIE